MPATYPGQFNTFVANHEASEGMIVGYSRNPDEFKLAEWAQYKTVKQNHGLWQKQGYEESGRLNDESARFWPDGAPRPSNNGNVENFEWLPYRTRRYERGFNLGSMSVSQATWDIIAQNSRSAAQNSMTFRTKKAVDVATNAANFLASHQNAVVTGITGITGFLDQSTTVRGDIKKTFDHMANAIRLRTLGAVKSSDLMVVMGPHIARLLAATQEIREYLMQQENAHRYITGAGLGPVNDYGLPDTLYGYKVVIENAVYHSAKKGSAFSPLDVWPNRKLCMFSRIGGLEAPEGPSFSSITAFLKEEMTVEDMEDTNNRVHTGSIVDDFEIQLTAPEASYIIEDVLAP